jgi:ArsR family transcriptional regulator
VTTPSILKHVQSVADPTRCRLLRILGRQELTVSELCAVLQLPQSTVSRHLKTLGDDNWVQSRRDGTSRFYTLAAEELATDARELWSLIRIQMDDQREARQDDRRLEGVLATRRTKAREFFAAAADQWDRLRAELFGATFHLRALLGLLDDQWTVGDLGCGSGHVAQALAPFVSRVVAVDGSHEMLEAARARLGDEQNVEFHQGELESLPLASGSLDGVVLGLVLHYVPDPVAVVREAARVLRPGGRLLIVELCAHERDELQQRMGHVWLGFSEVQIGRILAGGGLERVRVRPLPAEPDARGPSLFAATARKPGL